MLKYAYWPIYEGICEIYLKNTQGGGIMIIDLYHVVQLKRQKLLSYTLKEPETYT